MGVSSGRFYRSGIPVEGPYRRRISMCRSRRLPGGNPATVSENHVAEAAPVLGGTGHLFDRPAVGRIGDVAKSAFLRLHISKRTGTVSRIFLVLLHERAR